MVRKNYWLILGSAVVFLGFPGENAREIFGNRFGKITSLCQASRGLPCKPCKPDAGLHVVAGIAGNFCTTGCVLILVCAVASREVWIFPRARAGANTRSHFEDLERGCVTGCGVRLGRAYVALRRQRRAALLAASRKSGPGSPAYHEALEG